MPGKTRVERIEPTEEPVVQAGVALLGTQIKWLDFAGYGLVAMVALGFLMVARGQLKRSHKAWSEAEARGRAQVEAEASRRKSLETEGDTEENNEVEDQKSRSRRQELKDKIRKQVTDDPNTAAQVVRKWLYE